MDHAEYVAKTASHYTKQWGAELSFGDFVKANPEAAKTMPSRQLPWQQLFDRIRKEAEGKEVRVYDAACGYGDIMNSLTAQPNPPGLRYFGMDIHDSLSLIKHPGNVTLQQGDITKAAGQGSFDFVLCRAAIHHTPDPASTYRVLVDQLNDRGTVAITAYAKKAPMREAVDDALRSQIVPMNVDEAFAVANQITRLGRDLQASEGQIVITQDLPFLGIAAGRYGIQDFVYRHFMKCWHNPAYLERHCDIANFDWYHPPYAYRFELDELTGWAKSCGLAVARTASTEAQHYLEAEKR